MKRQHINMDNYEEYFLLYVDNELTAAEKASVDQFVMQHPELRPELDMFLDTRLDPETIEFEGKDELLRTGSKINEGNVEEFQVLLLDGELDALSAAELEAYHCSHKKAAANFEWLKKAKLPDEAIVFPDKALLYRTEKKPATIISFTWTRIAVAASVVLIAGLFWFLQTSAPDTVSEPRLAVTEPKTSTPAGNDQTIDPGNATQDNTLPVGTDKSSNADALVSVKEERNNATQKLMPEINKEQPVTYATLDRNNNTVAEERNQGALNVPVESIAEKPGVDLNMSENAVAKEALAMNVKTNYVSEALDVDQATAADEYGDEEQGKRKGFRGLVRKVNRFYNKATNPDPEKAVVKVASFEIGLPR